MMIATQLLAWLLLASTAASYTSQHLLRCRPPRCQLGSNWRASILGFSNSKGTPPPPPPAQPVSALSPEDLVAKMTAAEMEYGRDPRLAPPWITEDAQLLAELEARSQAPRAAFASKSAVKMINCLADFEAVLERSRPGTLVCIKFYAPHCNSCHRLRPLYEHMAESPMSQFIQFCEVDTTAARVFCALCNIKKMPVAHTYARANESCALIATHLIETPTKFYEFGVELSDRVQAPMRSALQI